MVLALPDLRRGRGRARSEQLINKQQVRDLRSSHAARLAIQQMPGEWIAMEFVLDAMNNPYNCDLPRSLRIALVDYLRLQSADLSTG